MRLKIEYCVENIDNDTERNEEIVFEKSYNSNAKFFEIVNKVVGTFEDETDVTIDQGGDDNWHELTVATVIYEDEVVDALPMYNGLVKELESALKEWEA